MHAVVTVTGTDRRGIIAKVSAFLFEHGVNIEDISQTILGGQFAMIMMVDVEEETDFSRLAEELSMEGERIGMSIRLQHAALFDAMHTV